MKKLSTGADSTLGNWYSLCVAVFGKDSAPSLFVAEKIAKQGSDEEVITDEGQLLAALGAMFLKEMEKRTDESTSG